MPFGHGEDGYVPKGICAQEPSGLGLDAQGAAIRRFAAAESLSILAEFVESETGKGADALDRRTNL